MSRIESLLAERGWLERLSAQLLRDEHAAEDLAQETALAALRYAPDSPADLRAWLARVARNLAAKTQRRQRNRSLREAAVARPELVPDPAERFAIQQSVAQALLRLDEPYRTTLLLRYWEDLPLKEVARRMAVPVETVRTRIRRALATLRERLDDEHGERRTWTLPLVLLPRPAADAASAIGGTGAVLMSKKLIIAPIGLVLIAAIGWLSGLFVLGSEPGRERTQELAKSVIAEDPVARGSSDASTPESARRLVQEVASLATLQLSVRFAGDGTAAEGIGLYLRRIETDGGRAPRPAVDSAPGREARTGQGGNFRFDALEPGEYSLELDRCPGTRVHLAPGEERSLALEIPRGVDVQGTVVSSGRTPVGMAEVFRLTPAHPRMAQLVATTDESGRFHIRDLAPGTELLARADGWQPSRTGKGRPYVTGEPGDQVRIVLELGARGTLVQGQLSTESGEEAGAALLVFAVDEDTRKELEDRPSLGGQGSGRSGVDREPILLDVDDRGRFSSSEVPAGTALVIARGRDTTNALCAVQLLDVQAGENPPCVIRLRPGATVEGSLVDEQGAPFADQLLESIWLGSPDLGRLEGELAERLVRRCTISDSKGRFRLVGLLPGRHAIRRVLRGRHAGTFRLGQDAETLEELTVVQHGQYRVHHVLPRTWTLELRFLDSHGAPLQGFGVSPSDPEWSSVNFRGMRTTDAKGTVCFRELRAARICVSVHAPDPESPKGWDRMPVWTRVFSRTEAPTTVRFDAGQSRQGRVRAVLVDADGSVPHARLELRLRGFDEPMRLEADEYGAFTVDGLCAGDYVLHASSSRHRGEEVARFSLLGTEERDLGQLRLRQAARLRVRVDGGDRASVHFVELPSGKHGRLSYSEEAGLWTSQLMRPGRYLIVARAPGSAPVGREILLQEGDRRQIEIHQEPGRSQRFRVFHVAADRDLARTGPGIDPSVHVRVLDNDGRLLFASSGSGLPGSWVDVGRRIAEYSIPLLPGSYRIEVEDALADVERRPRAEMGFAIAATGLLPVLQVRCALRAPSEPHVR